MRAQVPYLARLARRAAGPAPLQPPRQLFAGTAYPLVRLPAGDDYADSLPERNGEAAAGGFPPALAPAQAHGEPPASPRITSQPGEDTSQSGEYTAGNRAGDASAFLAGNRPGGAPAPVDSAVHAGNADSPAAPGRPDRPGSAQVPLSPPLAPHAESTQVADATPATSPAGPIARPGGPPSASPPPAHAARGGPPGSSAIAALWGAPVELPHSIERAPVTSEASTRPAMGPALAPPRPGRAAAADTDQGQLGGVGTQGTPGGWEAASDCGRHPAPAAVRDLLPPLTQAPRPAELAGPGSGGSRQEPPGGPAPARVSIGTIEVTVVPPARPALRASQSRPPAQMPRGRSGPQSLLAATAAGGRLRDGLRRWYGIAQG